MDCGAAHQLTFSSVLPNDAACVNTNLLLPAAQPDQQKSIASTASVQAVSKAEDAGGTCSYQGQGVLDTGGRSQPLPENLWVD